MSRLACTGLALALALALAFAAAAPATPAAAGTYTVSACMGSGGTGVNNSWTPFALNGGSTVNLDGQSKGSCAYGIGIGSDLYPPIGYLAQNGWTLAPPPGSTLTAYRLWYWVSWNGSGLASQLDSGAGGVQLAAPCFAGQPVCGWNPGGSGSWGWSSVAGSGSWTQLRLVTYCVASQCSGSYEHAYWQALQVTVSDPTPPSVQLTGGGLAGGGWVAGTQQVSYAAADAGGIRRMRLWVDGQLRSDDARTCDYSYAAPCQNSAGSYSVDTTQLADGPHTVSVEARDATDSNASTASATFYVSNRPPAAPALSVDGGGAWQSTASWTLRFTNPSLGDPAPIAAALYEACALDGSGCHDGSAPVANGSPGAANSLTGGFGITAPGAYTVKLWLCDAAGNASAQNASNAVTLRFDTGAPGTATIAAPSTAGGWIGGPLATTFSPTVDLAPSAPMPASGIAGYAVTVDGSTPGTTVSLPVGPDGHGATLAPPSGGWPEGVDTIRARAISGAGVAAPTDGSLVLHVDRTPPAVTAEGYGAPAPAWQPGPVAVRLVATDALSGVGAADDSEPIAAGAYIAYTLDTGAEQSTRGGLATVAVSGQGQHWISFRAYDLAGNVSATKTVYVDVGVPSVATVSPAGFSAQSTNPATTFTAARCFGAPCPAQATLTPAADTYVDQSTPDGAYGDATALAVRSSQAANARALLDFALPAAGGCSVTSAVLRLHATASAPGRTLEVFRAGSSWNAGTVTWATRPGVTGDPATFTSLADGWQPVDVTALVQDLYAYGDAGLVVRDASEGAVPAAAEAFTSSEGQSDERPQLVVTFG